LIFNTFMTFLCLMSSYLYVYLAAFRIDPDRVVVEGGGEEGSYTLFYVMSTFECFFFFEIMAKFVTSY